jgi:hypothetical protein
MRSLVALRNVSRRKLGIASLSLSTNTPAKVEENFLPINFKVAAKIEGEESQIATVHLAPGERLRAESGAFLFMTESIQMESKLGTFLLERFIRL